MPLRAANASPSAVTAARQSTTVPNTSCTSVWISVIAILPDEAFRSGRLLRFARNDSKKSCHCEERSDEAISSNIDLRSSQHSRLGGEAEDAAPVEAEALVLRLAAHEANVDRKSTRLNSSHPSNSYAVFC